MIKLGDLLARVVPYRFRQAHHLIANVLGFFWVPCPLCSAPFGGHEWRDIDRKPSYVWIQREGPGVRSKGICPRCTKMGLGVAHLRTGERP